MDAAAACPATSTSMLQAAAAAAAASAAASVAAAAAAVAVLPKMEPPYCVQDACQSIPAWTRHHHPNPSYPMRTRTTKISSCVDLLGGLYALV